MQKIEDIPKVEMPEPKKKVVVFAKEDKIFNFGSKPDKSVQSPGILRTNPESAMEDGAAAA